MGARSELWRQFKRLPGVGTYVDRAVALERRVEALSSQVAQLSEAHAIALQQTRESASAFERLARKVEVLERAFRQDRVVDMVNFSTMKVFQFVDDLSYRNVHESLRHYRPSLAELEKVRLGLPKTTLEQLYDADVSSPDKGAADRALKEVLLAHCLLNGLDDFIYVDVGCQYGPSAIHVAQTLRACGRKNRVVAFEPGLASALVAYNLEINGLTDEIVFERAAVCDVSAPMIMFGEAGQSENNRIVNRAPDSESFSYVVPATTLDDYMSRKGWWTDLIVKIDTQGAEPEVWSGMTKLVKERCVCAFVEFTPCALVRDVKPLDFLRKLGEGAALLDTWDHPTLVRPSDYEAFISRIDNSPSKWTDLLILPDKLPRRDELVARLTVA